MKTGLKNLMVVLAVAGIANGANATANLTIYDGVNPLISINDNGLGDLNAASGELTVSTNVGVWSLSISSGATKPALGSATNPVMDIVVQASSTAAGSLRYVFSDNGFGPASGTLNATVSGHVISGAASTVDYSVYGDPGNVVGVLTTLLTTTVTIPLPVLTSNSGPLALSTPFSLSEVVQLTASGASAVSVDASLNVTPIPEPGTAGLTFLGLTLLVAGLARCKRSPHSAN
jgi:hypothetical protein